MIDSLIASDTKFTVLELATRLKIDQAVILLPSYLLESDFS